MSGGLIDERQAWVLDTEAGKQIQKLRVFLDNFVAEFVPSGLKNAGRHTSVDINASSWTALPLVALTDRNAIAIQNNSAVEVKINYDNSIATYSGMTIRKNGGERQYDIKDTIIIYAKCKSGTATLDVEELS